MTLVERSETNNRKLNSTFHLPNGDKVTGNSGMMLNALLGHISRADAIPTDSLGEAMAYPGRVSGLFSHARRAINPFQMEIVTVDNPELKRGRGSSASSVFLHISEALRAFYGIPSETKPLSEDDQQLKNFLSEVIEPLSQRLSFPIGVARAATMIAHANPSNTFDNRANSINLTHLVLTQDCLAAKEGEIDGRHLFYIEKEGFAAFAAIGRKYTEACDLSESLQATVSQNGEDLSPREISDHLFLDKILDDLKSSLTAIGLGNLAAEIKTPLIRKTWTTNASSVVGQGKTQKCTDGALNRRYEELNGERGLSPREKDVLGHLGKGLQVKEIAAVLNIAESTVRTHKSRILLHFGVSSSLEAVLKAIEAGLITDHYGATKSTYGLSEREREILDQLLKDYGINSSGKAAARALGLAEKTIHSHKTSIFRKLGVRNIIEAARAAIENSTAPIEHPVCPK